MGTMTGYGTNMEGDTIKVAFTGAELSNSDIDDNVIDVRLQMDGGSEYAPVKITTASITFLTDGTGLMNISVSEGVKVIISNETIGGSILFAGYVVPNSFNQSVLGCNDQVTIECTDYLGYSKFLAYKLVVSDRYSVITLAEAVNAVCRLIGVDKALMAALLRLNPGGANETKLYPAMSINESFFYSGLTPPRILNTFTYEANALSCYEVLEMIAKSFRCTWIQSKDVLFMVDPVQMRDGEQEYLDTSNLDGGVNIVDEIVAINEAMVNGAMNISSLPKYTYFSMKNNIVDSIPLYHDLLSHALLYEDGTRVSYKEDNTTYVVCRLSSYAAYTLSLDMGGPDLYSQLVAWKNFTTTEMLMGKFYQPFGEDWEVALRVEDKVGSSQKVFGVRSPFITSVQNIYGCSLAIKARISISNNSDDDERLYPYKTYDIAAYSPTIYITVKVGDLYYDYYGGTWRSARSYIPVTFFQEDKFFFGNDILSSYLQGKIPLQVDAQDQRPEGFIDINVYSSGNLNKGWNALYLHEFSVDLVPNDAFAIAIYDQNVQKEELFGDFAYKVDPPEIERPIRFDGGAMFDKNFGLVVNGVDYGALTGTSYRFSTAGGRLFTWQERVEALANSGDRLEYQITLDDKNNLTTPLAVYTAPPLWNGNKIVTGYEKDITNSTITLILE